MMITDEHREWLKNRAKQGLPFELCGFIMEDGQIVEIRNVAKEPEKGFVMDGRQIVEKLSGNEAFITGIWHTHPSGNCSPSRTDVRAVKMGHIQRNWVYVIATKDQVAEYNVNNADDEDNQFWLKFVR